MVSGFKGSVRRGGWLVEGRGSDSFVWWRMVSGMRRGVGIWGREVGWLIMFVGWYEEEIMPISRRITGLGACPYGSRFLSCFH